MAMAFSPDALLDAVPPIPSHALARPGAVAIGGWQLVATKGTRRHRIVVAAMACVAVVPAGFISTTHKWGYFMSDPVRAGAPPAGGDGGCAMIGESVLEVDGLAKTFVMHLRGGVVLPVAEGVSFRVTAGECVVLGGPSGAGKSSILKIVAGTYRASAGAVRVRHQGAMVDITQLSARDLVAVRRGTIANVTQFLNAIPRVPALELVAAPVVAAIGRDAALAKAAELLARLNLPERLWSLPPATFSGGEKQRVNIAAGFIRETPLLLVDEPTASLDATNRDVVVDLIAQKKAAGTAVLGIFHDEAVRDRVADRILDVTRFAPAREAA